VGPQQSTYSGFHNDEGGGAIDALSGRCSAVVVMLAVEAIGVADARSSEGGAIGMVTLARQSLSLVPEV